MVANPWNTVYDYSQTGKELNRPKQRKSVPLIWMSIERTWNVSVSDHSLREEAKRMWLTHRVPPGPPTPLVPFPQRKQLGQLAAHSLNSGFLLRLKSPSASPPFPSPMSSFSSSSSSRSSCKPTWSGPSRRPAVSCSSWVDSAVSALRKGCKSGTILRLLTPCLWAKNNEQARNVKHKCPHSCHENMKLVTRRERIWSHSTWPVRDLTDCCLFPGPLNESGSSIWLNEPSPSFLERAMHVSIFTSRSTSPVHQFRTSF